MNHELVHVVQGDIASEEDRRWRRLLPRQGRRPAAKPGIAALQLSHDPALHAPRAGTSRAARYSSRRGWAAGWAARRAATTRWCSARWCATTPISTIRSGLASRGTQVDFQVGVERLPLRHALLHVARVRVFAGEGRRVDQARRRQRALLLRPISAGVRHAARAGLAGAGSPSSTSSSGAISPRSASSRSRHTARWSRTRWDRCRACTTTRRPARSTAPSAIPGVVEHVGALNTRDGSVRRLADIKRAMHYRSRRLPTIRPADRLLHQRQLRACRDLMAVDVKTGEERMLLEDARIGEMVFNPVDRSLMGVRHVTTASPRWCAFRIRTTSGPRCTGFPTSTCPTTSTSRPTGGCCRRRSARSTATSTCACGSSTRSSAGDMKPLSEFRFGQSVPGELRVLAAMGATCTAAATTRAFPTSSATRWPPARSRRSPTRKPASSGPCRSPTGASWCSTTPGTGFVPAIIEPQADRGRQRDHVPGHRGRGEVPRRQDVAGAAAQHRRRGKADHGQGPVHPAEDMSTSPTPIPVVQGYKNTAGDRISVQLRGSAAVSRISASPRPTRPDNNLPGDQRGHIDITGRYRVLARRAVLEPVRLLRPVRPHQAQPQGLCGQARLRLTLIYDAPRKLEANFDIAYYDQIDTLPNAQNVETNFTRLVTGRGRAPLHGCAAIAGRSRRRKGHRLEAGLPGESRQRPGDARSSTAVSISACHCRLPHSSMWSRTAAGVANGDYNTTVANFYFGGFGNNYVDDGPIQRYREYYSMPGFGLQEISALKFVKEMVEWNVPPVGLRECGHAQLLSDTGSARRSSPPSCGRSRPARRCARTTQASGPRATCVSRPALVRHDIVGGLCGWLSGLPARGHRVDGLAQDHVGMGLRRNADALAARGSIAMSLTSSCTSRWAPYPSCASSATLLFLDSYKLVPMRSVVAVVACGVAVAGASYFANAVAARRHRDGGLRLHAFRRAPRRGVRQGARHRRC